MTRRRALRAHPCRGAGGMTLLEVLFASALLGVIFVNVFAIVWSTIVTRQEIEAKAIPWSVGPAVMQRIVEDLQWVQVESIDDAKDCFRGTGDRSEETRLDFLTALPSRDKVKVGDDEVRAQVNEVGYRLRDSEGESGQYALFRREDFGVDDEPAEGGRYYKLCDRVKEFRIDYFAEDPGDPSGDDAEGLREWDYTKEGKLPWGVRITLVIAPNLESEISDDDEDRPPEDYVFAAVVPFRTRYDRSESKPAGPGNPGGGR